MKPTKKSGRGERRHGILRGGRGGKDRRSRSARVVDPGLFYALRAVVKVVLWLAEGSPGKSEPTGELLKLRTWHEEARHWREGFGDPVPGAHGSPDGASPVAQRETHCNVVRHRGRRQGERLEEPGSVDDVPGRDSDG